MNTTIEIEVFLPIKHILILSSSSFRLIWYSRGIFQVSYVVENQTKFLFLFIYLFSFFLSCKQ